MSINLNSNTALSPLKVHNQDKFKQIDECQEIKDRVKLKIENLEIRINRLLDENKDASRSSVTGFLDRYQRELSQIKRQEELQGRLIELASANAVRQDFSSNEGDNTRFGKEMKKTFKQVTTEVQDKETDKSLENYDNKQVSNMLQVNTKNKSITLEDIKIHNEKVENFKQDLQVKKKVEIEKLLEKQKNKRSISPQARSSDKDSRYRAACTKLELELKEKKEKEIINQMQRQKCGEFIRELVPAQIDKGKQEEMEKRLKNLASPKSKIEKLKALSSSGNELGVQINPTTGKPILKDYLEELRSIRSEKLDQEESSNKRKKLEPLKLIPTVQIYAGHKPERSVPKMKLERPLNYLKHKINDQIPNINIGKWKKTQLSSQNMNIVKSSVERIEDKIKQNKLLLSYKTYDDKLAEETTNLLLESINAKLAMIDQVI